MSEFALLAMSFAILFFCSTFWLAIQLKARDAENHRLEQDREMVCKDNKELWELLQSIADMETPRANATVKRMAKAARGWS